MAIQTELLLRPTSNHTILRTLCYFNVLLGRFLIATEGNHFRFAVVAYDT